MDVFEYGFVCISFKDEKKDGEEVTNGFVKVVTYDLKGDTQSKAYELKGPFLKIDHSERIDEGDGYYSTRTSNFVATTNLNYSIAAIMPYLSMLGLQGWEVVGYKTDNDPVFGQALLKRRIQK